jgi:hypothetical protein
MNINTLPYRLSYVLLLGALLPLSACQSTKSQAPQQTQISNEVTASAEVMTVDRSNRLLSMRQEDGKVFSVFAGDEVRNFDQINVGDQLVVRYREKLSATRRVEWDGKDLDEVGLDASRAQPGAKPGVKLGLFASLIVKIESIDLENNIVVFSTSSGDMIAHNVATPEGRAFLQGLERGDRVQLDYTESVALSIEEQ